MCPCEVKQGTSKKLWTSILRCDSIEPGSQWLSPHLPFKPFKHWCVHDLIREFKDGLFLPMETSPILPIREVS
jgi:hypothetical protein